MPNNSSDNLLNQIKQQAYNQPTPYYQNVGEKMAAQMPSPDRFPTYFEGLNNEDLYAKTQTTGEKWANAVPKFLSLTASTAVSGTVGLVYGATEAFKSGDFTKFYDNQLISDLNDWTSGLEDKYATYQSEDYKNAAWYSPETWASANFWSDTVFKNAGFALGAYLSGGAWSKVFGLVGKASQLISKTPLAQKAIQALNVAEDAGFASRQSQAFTNLSKSLKDIANQTTKNPLINGIASNAKEYGDNLLRSLTAASGEAQIEAFQAKKEYKERLISAYTDANGVEPTGADLADIEETASSVGNSTFGLNMALLTGTNLYQFPKILGRTWNADKDALGRMVVKNAEGKIVQREGIFGSKLAADASKGETLAAGRSSFLADQLERTKVGKALNRISPVQKLLFAPNEAFEEATQYIIPKSAEAYYDQGSDTKGSYWGSFKKGVSKSLTEKDFFISLMSGGITGGMMETSMQRGSNIFANRRDRQRTQGVADEFNKTAPTAEDPKDFVRQEREARTAAGSFINQLKNSTLGSHMQELSRSVNRSVKLNQEAEEALINNDRLQYEDVKNDKFLNYLLPRIQYGREDLVKNDIEGWKRQASTEEGWEQMMSDELVDDTMTREDFVKQMDTMLSMTDTIKSQYRALQIRYGGVKNENGSLKYTPNNFLQMAYVTSKVDNYNERINTLTSELGEFGASTNFFSLLDEASKKNIDDEYSDYSTTAAGELADEIDNHPNLTGEQKDDIKQKITDILELTARRKYKLDEYEAMREDPQAYDKTEVADTEDDIEEEVPEEAPKPSVNAKEKFYKNNKDKTFTINRGRQGKEEGTIVYNSKDNVLAFKGKDGKLYEITKKDFESGLIEHPDQLGDITYDDFINEEDSRVAIKEAKVIAAITEHFKNKKEELLDKQKKLEDTKQKLKELSDKLVTAPNEAVNDLILTFRDTETEIENLENEKITLQEQADVYQAILDGDTYDYRSVLNEIESQMDSTKELLKDLNIHQNKLINLLADIKTALTGFAKMLKERIDLRRVNKANIVLDNASKILDYFVRTQEPNFDSLKDVTEKILSEKIEITKTQKDKIDGQIQDIIKQVAETENDLSNRTQVYDEMQQTAWNIAHPLNYEDFIDNTEIDLITEVEELPTNNTEEETTAKFFFGAKKLIQNFFSSTKVLPDNTEPKWYKRYNKATRAIAKLPSEERAKLKVIMVTASNQEALGLDNHIEEFYQNYYKTSKLSPSNPKDGAITAIIVKETEKGLVFVDENMNELSLVGTKIDASKVVGSKMSTLSYQWKNGQEGLAKNYSKEDKELHLNNYASKRVELLADNSAAPKTYQFRLSRGVAKSNEEADVIGNVLSEEDINKPVIKLARTGEKITTIDGQEITVKSKVYYIKSEDSHIPLLSRKIDKQSAINLLEALKEFANRTGTVNSRELTEFIAATVPSKIFDGGKTVTVGKDQKQYDLRNLSKEDEDSIVSYLTTLNHKVREDGFMAPFTEFTYKDGVREKINHPTYQSYLLSNSNGRISPLSTMAAQESISDKYMLVRNFLTTEATSELETINNQIVELEKQLTTTLTNAEVTISTNTKVEDVLTETQKNNLAKARKNEKAEAAKSKFSSVNDLINHSKSLMGQTFNVSGLNIQFVDYKGEVLTGAGQRVFVKVLINGVPITFYSSTGSGKKSLQEGVFYPTLGIEADERFNGTWINKIDGVEMASYYNSAALAVVGNFLDGQFGNTNSFAGAINQNTNDIQNPTREALTREQALEIRRGYNKDFLNSGRETFSNNEKTNVVAAFKDLVKEINSVLKQPTQTSKEDTSEIEKQLEELKSRKKELENTEKTTNFAPKTEEALSDIDLIASILELDNKTSQKDCN